MKMAAWRDVAFLPQAAEVGRLRISYSTLSVVHGGLMTGNISSLLSNIPKRRPSIPSTYRRHETNTFISRIVDVCLERAFKDKTVVNDSDC